MELSRLAMHYHNSLSSPQIASRNADFCQDLVGLSLQQIRNGCRRYRDNPENKFFPAPGQLLEACKSPFADAKPRRYAEQADLPPPQVKSKIEKMLELSRTMFKWGRPETEIAHVKQAILERPPLKQTPEQEQLERELRDERMATLERRLAERHN